MKKCVYILLIFICLFSVACKEKTPRSLPAWRIASFDTMEPIQGFTKDDPPIMYIARVSLEYDIKNKALLSELAQKKPLIADKIRNHLSSRMRFELQGENEITLKNDLLNMINRELNTGKLFSVLILELHFFDVGDKKLF